MKVAFSTISCPSYSVSQIAKAADEYGYDGVELYALEGQLLTPELLAARVPEISQGLGATQIVCVNSASTLAAPDAEGRTRSELAIAHAMESASDLGSPLVKAFGGEVPPNASSDFFDGIAASIERLVKKAKTLGVVLVVETHDGFCRGAMLKELLDRVDEPEFHALWDMHHPFRMGESPDETDKYIGDRVKHLHVKDARRTSEGWDYTELGAGEVPVQRILELMRARKFDGYVSLDWEKMWHPHIAGPEIALPQYRRKLSEYLSS